MDHTLEMPSDAQTSIRADGDLARLTISTTVTRGQRCR